MSKLQAVIGAGYGDEGKGFVTDYLSKKAISEGKRSIVILSNGGAQRGHTVETDDGKRFIFHHLGSGSFAGAPTYFSPDYIVNPLMFLRDREDFLRINGDEIPEVYADPGCRFTTPFDMIANQIFEDFRGENRHGSVGAGIWETVRRYQKGPRLSISEMFGLPHREQLAYMEQVKAYAETRIFENTGLDLSGLIVLHNLRNTSDSILTDWKEIWNIPDLITNFLRDFKEMMYLINLKPMQSLSEYDILIVENAQGILLSQDRYDGTNHTTPSDTGAKEIRRLLDAGLKDFVDETELYYVSRSYLTKHGAGSFPEECDKEEICEGMQDLTNVPNPYQETLRYGKLCEQDLIDRILEDMADITGSLTEFSDSTDEFTDTQTDCTEIPADNGTYPAKPFLVITHVNESVPDFQFLKKAGFPVFMSDGRTGSSVCEI